MVTSRGPGRIVVVGASLAGWNAVRALRAEGFGGSLTLVGDESHGPYDRPPLSKDYLAGRADRDRLDLTAHDDVAALDVDRRVGTAAVALDVAGRTVRLADGASLDFDGLVVATGARVRHLPGTEALAGVHALRTVDDADALRADLAGGPRRVVVIGAGFIGLEVAATARQAGHDVTVVEAAPTPLVRSVGARVGATIAEVHRGHGVDVRLGVGVDAVEGDRAVQGVRLDDGTVIAADVVVAGIGVTPATEWLASSGLTLEDGVRCDGTCLAAPGVVAAGDVASFPNALFDDEVMRVEHWDHAIAMGAFAARRLLAGDAWDPAERFAPVPFFWSDQYDRKLQSVGRIRPDDEVVLLDGDPAEHRFVTVHVRAGRVVGAFGMNRPRHVMRLRGLIADRADLDRVRAELA